MKLPRIVLPTDAPDWAQRLEADLNNALLKIASMSGTVPRYTKADLPRDRSINVAIVTDETGGETLAFFDLTDWRRVQDRAIVS